MCVWICNFYHSRPQDTPKIIRELKYVLRERLSIVKDRTRLKNKIHGLLVRSLVHPEGISDIFGAAGRKYIDSLELDGHAVYLLRHYLDMFDLKTAELKGFEKYLKTSLKGNRYTELLKTIPGIGNTLSALISLEVHDISRFPTHKQFASYCGLVPTTHSSGNKITSGHLTPSCNKYLRTALIEGSWVAVGKSPYFKQRYEQLKKRMKPNVAIAAVARRMSEIIFCMLNEDRAYTERYTKDI